MLIVRFSQHILIASYKTIKVLNPFLRKQETITFDDGKLIASDQKQDKYLNITINKLLLQQPAAK